MESCVEDGKYMLTLSELHQLYSDRLRDFGIEKEVNRTRLKLRILSQFSEKLQEQFDGKNGLLVLREKMSKRDYESDTLTLAKAARIVRRKMFNDDRFQFNGAFPSNCQNASVLSWLKVLI